MKVLITGGAGFIGSHTAEEFLQNGYDVAVLDDLSSGLAGNLPKDVRLHVGGLQGKEMAEAFREEQPDVVIHLAAQVSVGKSMDDPFYDNFINTACTVKVLELCRRYGTKKLIFASSAAVYGEPSYLPVDEKHPLKPISFYSLSKASGERYITLYEKEYGLRSCILRFSNVYGPRQDPKGEAGVVAIFTNKLLMREHVTIFGGAQTRDFIYVEDVARACRQAAESNESGIFNISSCTETTVEQLFGLIAGQMRSWEDPLRLSLRPGEIGNSVLSNMKAAERLGWSPSVLLEEGLRRTVEYSAKRTAGIGESERKELGV